MNKDGTRSRYCDKHLAVHSTAGRRKDGRRPAIVRPAHVELDEDGRPLPFGETKAGKAFAIAFLRAVHRLSTKDEPRVTLAEIKRFMGEEFNERFALDTAHDWEASGKLEYRQKGQFMAWKAGQNQ